MKGEKVKKFSLWTQFKLEKSSGVNHIAHSLEPAHVPAKVVNPPKQWLMATVVIFLAVVLVFHQIVSCPTHTFQENANPEIGPKDGRRLWNLLLWVRLKSAMPPNSKLPQGRTRRVVKNGRHLGYGDSQVQH